MLLELRIRSFAIVEECRFGLKPGLVALTGETGAGKSIIVDALSACLGGRVGADVIRFGADHAEVEAVFASVSDDDQRSLPGYAEDDGVLILSRTILRGGRSIGRSNGRAVTVSALGEAGQGLVDVHGQSEHLSLLRPARQLDMLDHFAGLDGLRAEFRAKAEMVTAARRRLAELEAGRRAAEQKSDLLRFQIGEIEGAELKPDEVELLTAERSRLGNAGKLAGLVTEAMLALDADEIHGGARDCLVKAVGLLHQAASIDGSLAETRETAEGVTFQIEGLVSTLRGYRDRMEADPGRLDEVETRLDQIQRLLRKYGEAVADVLLFLDEARSELEGIERYEERLHSTKSEVAAAEMGAGEIAARLSAQREHAAVRFASDVRDRLARLGLGPARFSIKLRRAVDEDGIPVGGSGMTERLAFTGKGIDGVRFMVAFNAGEPVKPIEKVASGGETARFMLAVKAVLAGADDVPTLVFDEIDTGVGGRSGPVVGAMLAELGRSHQVIVITHLPHIAALASQHLTIAKEEKDGRTGIVVRELAGEERVREVAEMLSGSSPSEPAMTTARAMLANLHP